jgi:hypothetical protein
MLSSFLFKLWRLCALAGGISESECQSDAESFAQAAQNLNYSNTKGTKGAPQLITPSALMSD